MNIYFILLVSLPIGILYLRSKDIWKIQIYCGISLVLDSDLVLDVNVRRATVFLRA